MKLTSPPGTGTPDTPAIPPLVVKTSAPPLKVVNVGGAGGGKAIVGRTGTITGSTVGAFVGVGNAVEGGTSGSGELTTTTGVETIPVSGLGVTSVGVMSRVGSTDGVIRAAAVAVTFAQICVNWSGESVLVGCTCGDDVRVGSGGVVGVLVGIGVAVALGTGVLVTVGVWVAVGIGVLVGVAGNGSGVSDGVLVGSGVSVSVGIGVFVAV